MKTRRLVINASLLTLLIVSTFIKIPVFLVPFTLQLLVVIIISLTTNTADSLIIFLTYIIMGLIGIPIFASGGGISYLYNPSFGFILGFIIVAVVVNVLRNSLSKVISNSFWVFLISSIIGLICLYIFGFSYALVLFNHVLGKNYSLINILEIMVFPFILVDLLKCVLASYIVIKLKNIGSNIE